MSNTLAGIDPEGRPRIAAIFIPDDMKTEVAERCAKQGWTGLVWNKPIRKEDSDDPSATGDSSEA